MVFLSFKFLPETLRILRFKFSCKSQSKLNMLVIASNLEYEIFHIDISKSLEDNPLFL